MARVRRPTAGPGRPKKWPEELADLFLRVPKSYKERFDSDRGPMSRTEYFVFLMDYTHKDIKEMGRRIAELEQIVVLLKKELEQKDKIIAQKDKIIERQNKIIEEQDLKILKLKEKVKNLEDQLEALKQGRSVRSYQDARMLKALAEKAREGVSWKALCAEVLGLRDENKIKRLLKLAFVVKKDQHNKFPDRFYPKDIAEEFHGWVLKRPGAKADIIDYVLYREDTLKAAKGLAVGEAAKEKAPEVKPLKSGKAAERWLATFFEVVERQYMGLLNQKRGKDAKKYLEEKVPEKLEKVLAEIDPEDWQRAVTEVLEQLEAGNEREEAFVSNLRRVVFRAMRGFSRAQLIEVKNVDEAISFLLGFYNTHRREAE